ncbi:MAG: hypothetical protein NC388_06360 [Clostridium sp.]|nr:hypothetical protein [Clostridium sp.]
MNRIKSTAWMVGLCCLASSCSESFPGLNAPQGSGGKDVGSNEVVSDRIPILYSFNDPAYSILTRSTGAFGSVQEDRDHWKQARFRTFAWRTPNEANPDMTNLLIKDYDENKENPGVNWLLYGNEVILEGDWGKTWEEDDITYVNMKWAGKTPYYSTEHQDYKYNFSLCYYDDDTEDWNGNRINWNNANRTTTSLSANITIDGTNDIMTAVARPSRKKMESLEGQEYKPLLSRWSELIYSTYAGHRGVHPQFKMKHELVQLVFEVTPGDKKADGMVLEKVELVNPKTRAILTVADADTTKIGLTVADNQPKDITWSLPGKEDKDENGHYSVYANNILNEVMAFDQTLDKYHQKSTRLGTSFLVLPDVSYDVRLTCRENRYNEDGTVGVYTTTPYYRVRLAADYSQKFEAGHVYTIGIMVYGLQDIEMSMGAPQWIDGNGGDGDLNVDPDNPKTDDNYENLGE